MSVPVGAGNDERYLLVKSACLAAKHEFPGSSWNDPESDPVAALDALVDERDEALRKVEELSGLAYEIITASRAAYAEESS